jgi:hypothetical protein
MDHQRLIYLIQIDHHVSEYVPTNESGYGSFCQPDIPHYLSAEGIAQVL